MWVLDREKERKGEREGEYYLEEQKKIISTKK